MSRRDRPLTILVRAMQDAWDNSDLPPIVFTDDEGQMLARASLRALEAAGLAIVPVEPTNKMVDAAAKAMSPEHRPPHWVSVADKHRIRYRAMIAAAERLTPPTSED